MADFPGAPPEPIRSSELHELACTGATIKEGCVCPVLGQDDSLLNWHVAGWATRKGIDMHLSSLESLLVALEQRDMDPEQVDRFARLLQYGERMALARLQRRRKRR